MTAKEFAMWMAQFDECYPNSTQMKTDYSKQIWFNCMKDMSFEQASNALAQTFMTDKFEPKTPAVIRERAVITADDSAEWGEAWESVQHNIRFYGSCTYDPDRLETCMDSFDDLTRQTVKQLGWKDICLSENRETTRAQFRQVYETLRNRKRYQMQSATYNPQTAIEQKTAPALEEKEEKEVADSTPYRDRIDELRRELINL